MNSKLQNPERYSMACPSMVTGSEALAKGSSQGEFLDLAAADLVEAIKSSLDHDIHNSWLTRAYEAMNGSIHPDFLEEIENRLQIVKDNISALISDGSLTLWRGTAQRPLSTMGVHWSSDRGIAEGHGPYLVKAVASVTAVDWLGTAFRRISWPREQEISLRPGANLRVTTLEAGGQLLAAEFPVTISVAQRLTR